MRKRKAWAYRAAWGLLIAVWLYSAWSMVVSYLEMRQAVREMRMEKQRHEQRRQDLWQ